MASLSKCHLCLQYYHSIGKQPINILAGGISYKEGGDLCFLAGTYCVFIVIQDLLREVVYRRARGSQLCSWRY